MFILLYIVINYLSNINIHLNKRIISYLKRNNHDPINFARNLFYLKRHVIIYLFTKTVFISITDLFPHGYHW